MITPGLAAYRELVKAKVVDGDGDGLVYDNTPRERPATPAETALGRKLRRRRGGAMRTRDGSVPGKTPERWVLRGRDDKGNVVVEEVGTRDEAVAAGRKMQRKKFRNVRAIRLGQKGQDKPPPKKAKVPKKPEAKKPSAPTKPTKPEASAPEGPMSEYAQRAHSAVNWPTDFDENEKVVGANWIAMMTSAIRGDRNGFNENIGNFFQSTDEIQGTPDYDELMDRLDEMLGTLVTPEQSDALDQTFEEWGAFDFPQMREAWKQTGNPFGRATDVEAARQTPAYNHLSMGGSIEDAPSEGLIESIFAMPDRFDVKTNGAMSTRKNAWIVDKNGKSKGTIVAGENGPEEVDGDVWMLKGGLDEGVDLDQVGDDQLNEVLGAELFRGTGIQMADTKISEDGQGERFVMQRHVSQQFGGDSERVGGSDLLWDWEALQAEQYENGEFKPDYLESLDEETVMAHVDKAELAKLEDKGAILDMVLSDYLMGGVDRHGGNWGVHLNEKGGYRLQMWDNGGTFTSTSDDPAIEFDDWFAYTPPALATNYSNVVLARAALGDTPATRRKEVRKRMKEFLTQMRKVELAEVQKRAESQALDPKQRKAVRKQMKLVEKRLAYMEENIDKIAREIVAL